MNGPLKCAIVVASGFLAVSMWALATDLPGHKQLFAEEKWYKDAKEKEQTFEGTLHKADSPMATSGRWNPIRLVITEKDTHEVYLGSKTDLVDQYVGCKIRIVGKAVEVMQNKEIWPARIELLVLPVGEKEKDTPQQEAGGYRR